MHSRSSSFFAAAMGDPGTFRSKAGHVVLLLLEQTLGDEHGHGHIGRGRCSLKSASSSSWMFSQMA